MAERLDLVVIGGGSGGLTAAGFARSLGARVALVERTRIGGDCTWTGCIPSKALIRAARVAHELRTAGEYGITAAPPQIDLAAVMAYVHRTVDSVYRHEAPEVLQKEGIEVILAEARFLDAHTLRAGDRTLRAGSFLIATGARPFLPEIPGIHEIDALTYETIFQLEHLPERLFITGAGPIGCELGQAFSRLGARVTLAGDAFLAKEDPEATAILLRVFEREGLRFVRGLVERFERTTRGIVAHVAGEQIEADRVLIASGRRPVIDTLDLTRAGVAHDARGIPVDDRLRTSVRHIYAAGDVIGGQQFTHLAGWQAFQAVRNALLPGSSDVSKVLVPRVTFTDPELAQAGPLEAEAREQHGSIAVHRRTLERIDRAVCENDRDGVFKLITEKNGTLLGATILASRAGEVLGEVVHGIEKGWKAWTLGSTIHAYPTYSSGLMSLGASSFMQGGRATLARGLSRLVR